MPRKQFFGLIAFRAYPTYPKMPATMQSLFILALLCLLCLVERSSSQSCPAKYKRFSTMHTFCIPPSPTCRITRTGVSQQDKDLIVKLHNEFRSKVAMGNERESIGGPLPQAADMMQMVWDDELAAVAQKWTENCYFDHDCKECRAVENFNVGQNLAIQHHSRSGEPNWTARITSLYNEVKDYHTSWLGSFFEPGVKIGHFTQLIWSRSWRVGCGYSYYQQGGTTHQYYACNYGPGGNFETQPVYKPGQPCSACPTNTHCSTSSRGANTFPGLCKMDNPNTAPVYPLNPKGLLFYCSASSRDPDCQADFSGDGTLRTVNSVGGNYYSIALNGGQSATITFHKKITPSAKPFCLLFTFRKGPLDASIRDQSSLKASYKFDHGGSAGPSTLNSGTRFIDYPIGLRWGMKTKLSLTFSVPGGAGQHVLDLRKIMAYDGKCEDRKD